MAGRKDLWGCVGTSFRAKRWLSLDVCGLLGVSLSWSVHFYALIVIGALLISNSLLATSVYFALYVPTSLLAMASLYRAWTTDPGAVPMGARPLTLVRRASTHSLSGNNGGDNNGSSSSNNNNDDDDKNQSGEPPKRRRAVRRCHKCEDNYKPPRAHHDSVTGRCIVKFDHFCPWVGNSIGAMNHKFFSLFLLYTALSCLISLFILLVRVIHCGYLINAEEKVEALSDTSKGYREREQNPIRFLEEVKAYRYPECNDASPFVVGLLVASLVFLVFSMTMGCEQIEAIETGKGKIARMKMSVGQAGTEFSRVTEEFNEMFGGTSPRVSMHWLWPNAVSFPKGMKKVVLGYEWDPTYDFEAYESDHESDQEMEEMENGKAVSRVPSSFSDEGEGLVKKPPPADDISMSDVSGTHDDNLPPGMKNRKAASRQESAESEGLAPSPSNLPRIT